MQRSGRGVRVKPDNNNEQAGYERAVALNIKITEHVNAVTLSGCSGSLPLVCLGLHGIVVSLRPWAIPQQPAGELLHRMVVGSIAIANVPYARLTQKRCDDIFLLVCKQIVSINETTEAVTEMLVGASATEYAFVRRILAVLTTRGVTMVPYSCADTDTEATTEHEDDTGYTSTRCAGIVSASRDRNAHALGIRSLGA